MCLVSLQLWTQWLHVRKSSYASSFALTFIVDLRLIGDVRATSQVLLNHCNATRKQVNALARRLLKDRIVTSKSETFVRSQLHTEWYADVDLDSSIWMWPIQMVVPNASATGMHQRVNQHRTISTIQFGHLSRKVVEISLYSWWSDWRDHLY